MDHIHRIHHSGGFFIVPCKFARQAAEALRTGFPKLVTGHTQDVRQPSELPLVMSTAAITAIEKEKKHGAETEDSCSYN